MSIPKAVYEVVRQRARFRCEYCHYPELLSSAPLSIDHIQPQSLGGSDDLGNLALACRRCNERRYNFTTGTDPETGMEVSLFNPRQQQWSDHFSWSNDALQIIGKTPIGRATCNRLDLNDERREEPFIQNARRQWAIAGLHPPDDDPR
ncbi:MAG: HNH endonuclease signature motif containing protein [Leptolyngbyaceae cyanobacterium bins.59]|nr:HNH endonuclease signature motif containing protein [Leptolyngbyaceae cyanobacterium bins.59]